MTRCVCIDAATVKLIVVDVTDTLNAPFIWKLVGRRLYSGVVKLMISEQWAVVTLNTVCLADKMSPMKVVIGWR